MNDLAEPHSPVIRQMCQKRGIPVRAGRGRIGETECDRMIAALSKTA